MTPRRLRALALTPLLLVAALLMTAGGCDPANCSITTPSACGYPDVTNTGPTGTLDVVGNGAGQVSSGAGWHLFNSTGPGGWVVIEDNAVFQNLNSNGLGLVISGDHVLVSNVEVSITGGEDDDAVKVVGGDDVTIQDTWIHGAHSGNVPDHAFVGVWVNGGSAVHVNRTEISNVGVGVQFFGGVNGGTVDNSYIHNFANFDYGSGDSDHNNGISIAHGASSGFSFHHNTIFNSFSQTSAIALYHDDGTVFNVTINDNFLLREHTADPTGDTAYVVFGGNSGAGPNTGTHDVHVQNNRIVRTAGGAIPWIAAFSPGNANNTESGNYYNDAPASTF